MTNLRLILTSTAVGAAICGFVGALVGAIAAAGTSVLLPGVGLVVSGPLAAGIVVGLAGLVFGAVLGLLIAAAIIFARRRTYL